MDPIALKSQHKQQIIFDEAVQMFESRCELLSHFCCQCCHMIGMTIQPSCNNESICTTCQASHANREDTIKNLPIWYNENNEVQYQLPKELKCLREGEKLLIQQVAAYVPLLHLKDGQIGSRGHVCFFVQDISSICNVLPRLPNNVHFVKVVKKYLQESEQVSSERVVIRKQVVLDALRWLKQYDVKYAHI